MKEKKSFKEESGSIGKEFNIQSKPPSPPFDKPKVEGWEVRDFFEGKSEDKGEK